jgi:hypothetical protein
MNLPNQIENEYGQIADKRENSYKILINRLSNSICAEVTYILYKLPNVNFTKYDENEDEL